MKAKRIITPSGKKTNMVRISNGDVIRMKSKSPASAAASAFFKNDIVAFNTALSMYPNKVITATLSELNRHKNLNLSSAKGKSNNSRDIKIILEVARIGKGLGICVGF